MKGEIIKDEELEKVAGGRAVTYRMDPSGDKVSVEWTGATKGSTVVPMEKWYEYKTRCESRGDTFAEGNCLIAEPDPGFSKKIRNFFKKIF